MEQKPATRCAEQLVREPGPWPRWHHCKRKGVVSEGGKKWCKQHAPSSVKARQAKSDARFKADQDRRLAPYTEAKRLRAVNEELLKAIGALPAKPRSLAEANDAIYNAKLRAAAALEEARK